MIEFRMGGRRIRPDQFSKELEKAVTKVAQKGMQEEIGKKLRGICDPKTGAKPKVTQKGKTLSNLSFEISGSDSVMEQVSKRLK